MKNSLSRVEIEQEVDRLLGDLPTSVPRKIVAERLGRSEKSLANEDSLGIGITPRYFIGRRVFYPREAVIAYAKERASANGI